MNYGYRVNIKIAWSMRYKRCIIDYQRVFFNNTLRQNYTILRQNAFYLRVSDKIRIFLSNRSRGS